MPALMWHRCNRSPLVLLLVFAANVYQLHRRICSSAKGPMEHTLAANWAWGKGTCAPTQPITTNVSPTRGIWPLVIKRYHHTSKHRVVQHGGELKSLSGWLIYERRCKARLNGQPIPARANSAGFVAVQMAPSRESESGTTQQPTIRIEYARAEVIVH